ncbi:hypothetical protein MXB_740 [Myxobolus squamalis]|nr:hypothetical protein MXB_740 [Myxobolus squamalis]
MDIDANKEHRATIGQADKNPKMRKTFKALSVIDGLSSSGYLSKSQDIEADLIDTISTPKHASSKSEINEISQNTLKYRTVIPCKSKNASKSQGSQMENKLCQFLDTYNKKFFEKLEATPCEIFAAKQTAKKCPEELTFLIEIAQKFDLITSETVRVLACIEYNHCKNQPPDAIANLQNTDQDLKSYIQQMLGETETLDKEKANQSELIIWKSQKLYTIAVKFPQNDEAIVLPLLNPSEFFPSIWRVTTLKSNDYLDHFRDKNIQGTPDYIAPEVVLNKPYGRPADYWSIGIVLYEFLVGCTPFYGLTLEEIFESIVSSTLEWPSKEEGPPEEAQDIIIKLLNRNPLTRICSDLAKRHPFFRQIKWNCLLQTKAEFIPSFSSDDDTSFFDDRCERYNHNQLYLKNDPSVETTNSSAFTSYTKLFMDQTTKKPFSTSDPLFSEELSDTSITPESIYLSSDDSCFASSQIKKETEKSDSQLGVDDIPKKEEISISHYLQQIVQKIEIKRKSLAHDFGFSFKTDRVKCCKNISFLNHTVNFVRSQSPAFMSGLIPGMSIVFINNLTVIGQQHVKVLTTFANLKSICVEVCSLSQMDISVSNKSNPVYSFDIRSQFFNELVELQVVFEKRVNTEYNQVLLDHTCNIVQKLPEIFPYQRFKSTSQQQISRKLSMELPITPNKLKPCAQPKLSLAKKYPVYYKISKKDTIETPDSMQCLPVSLSPRASLIRITSQKLKAVKDILKHIT